MIIIMRRPQLAPNADLELWAIPESGDAPVSMGVLSEDQETVLNLGAREITLMPKTGALAISLEPEGGSPTGSPTRAGHVSGSTGHPVALNIFNSPVVYERTGWLKVGSSGSIAWLGR